MINGDLKEFIDGLYYGDERVFMYNNNKFFIQGYLEDEKLTLFLDRWPPLPMITSGKSEGQINPIQ